MKNNNSGRRIWTASKGSDCIANVHESCKNSYAHTLSELSLEDDETENNHSSCSLFHIWLLCLNRLNTQVLYLWVQQFKDRCMFHIQTDKAATVGTEKTERQRERERERERERWERERERREREREREREGEREEEGERGPDVKIRLVCLTILYI